MKIFNFLTAKEKAVFQILRTLPGDNLTMLGIRETCRRGNAREFREMIENLKSQMGKNSVLENCIPKDIMELITDF
jgi:hypothetical protein